MDENKRNGVLDNLNTRQTLTIAFFFATGLLMLVVSLYFFISMFILETIIPTQTLGFGSAILFFFGSLMTAGFTDFIADHCSRNKRHSYRSKPKTI